MSAPPEIGRAAHASLRDPGRGAPREKERGRGRILEIVATGAPLAETLDKLMLLLEHRSAA